MGREYRNMYDTYSRIFTRLGLSFRAVQADSGAIGGNVSHEFHVLADSGEDAIAFSTGSDYAANVELAEAVAPATPRPAPGAALATVATPGQKTIDDVSAFLGVPAHKTVKTLIVQGRDEGSLVALVLRGDHELNEVKAGKLDELPGAVAFAPEGAIVKAIGCTPGSIGPAGLPATIPVIVDRSAAVLADFVAGANSEGKHLTGINWDRDARITRVADLRKAMAGDPSPDGQGTLGIARGIEVGHVFQLGQKYAEAMNATVIDESGKARLPYMGCYGVGVSRIVAAAIEQNFDGAGIVWPEPMAPWRVAICVISPKNDTTVAAAAQALHDELEQRGVEVVLDDRGLRPGVMFADIELIGIPHRVVVSARGLEAGTLEYRARRAAEAEAISREELFRRLGV